MPEQAKSLISVDDDDFLLIGSSLLHVIVFVKYQKLSQGLQDVELCSPKILSKATISSSLVQVVILGDAVPYIIIHFIAAKQPYMNVCVTIV